jgi:hypothetical protein
MHNALKLTPTSLEVAKAPPPVGGNLLPKASALYRQALGGGIEQSQSRHQIEAFQGCLTT